MAYHAGRKNAYRSLRRIRRNSFYIKVTTTPKLKTGRTSDFYVNFGERIFELGQILSKL